MLEITKSTLCLYSLCDQSASPRFEPSPPFGELAIWLDFKKMKYLNSVQKFRYVSIVRQEVDIFTGSKSFRSAPFSRSRMATTFVRYSNTEFIDSIPISIYVDDNLAFFMIDKSNRWLQQSQPPEDPTDPPDPAKPPARPRLRVSDDAFLCLLSYPVNMVLASGENTMPLPLAPRLSLAMFINYAVADNKNGLSWHKAARLSVAIPDTSAEDRCYKAQWDYETLDRAPAAPLSLGQLYYTSVVDNEDGWGRRKVGAALLLATPNTSSKYRQGYKSPWKYDNPELTFAAAHSIDCIQQISYADADNEDGSGAKRSRVHRLRTEKGIRSTWYHANPGAEGSLYPNDGALS